MKETKNVKALKKQLAAAIRLILRVLQEVFLQSHAHRTKKLQRKDIWCK